MADIQIGRGYTYWFDSAGVHLTDGVDVVTWYDAYWDTRYAILRDEYPHLFVVDFELVDPVGCWQLKYSLDGGDWQTRGTECGLPPITAGDLPWTTEPHPMVGAADDMALDEAVLWLDMDPELDADMLEYLHETGLGGLAIDDCKVTPPDCINADPNDPWDPCHCAARDRLGLPMCPSEPFCVGPCPGPQCQGPCGSPGCAPCVPPPECEISPGVPCQPAPAIKPVDLLVMWELGNEYVQEILLWTEQSSGPADSWTLDVKDEYGNPIEGGTITGSTPTDAEIGGWTPLEDPECCAVPGSDAHLWNPCVGGTSTPPPVTTNPDTKCDRNRVRVYTITAYNHLGSGGAEQSGSYTWKVIPVESIPTSPPLFTSTEPPAPPVPENSEIHYDGDPAAFDPEATLVGGVRIATLATPSAGGTTPPPGGDENAVAIYATEFGVMSRALRINGNNVEWGQAVEVEPELITTVPPTAPPFTTLPFATTQPFVAPNFPTEPPVALDPAADVAALDSDKVIAVVQAPWRGGLLACRIGTVSGLDVSWGPAFDLETGNINDQVASLAVLQGTPPGFHEVALAAGGLDSEGKMNMKAWMLLIEGDTIAFGPASEVFTSPSVTVRLRGGLAAFDAPSGIFAQYGDRKVLATYMVAGQVTSRVGFIADIPATTVPPATTGPPADPTIATISWGTPHVVNYGLHANDPVVAAMTSSKAIVAWGEFVEGRSRVGSEYGDGQMAFGPPGAGEIAHGQSPISGDMARLTPTLSVWAWGGDADVGGSNSAVSLALESVWGAVKNFTDMPPAPAVDLDGLDETRFVVCYYDGDGLVKARVGWVELLPPGPAVHPADIDENWQIGDIEAADYISAHIAGNDAVIYAVPPASRTEHLVQALTIRAVSSQGSYEDVGTVLPSSDANYPLRWQPLPDGTTTAPRVTTQPPGATTQPRATTQPEMATTTGP